MLRILSLTFALAVAIMAATIITKATENAAESFRAASHSVGKLNT